MNGISNWTVRAHRRRYGRLTAAVALLAGTSILMIGVAAGTANAATSVNLGTADSYSVLAGSTVTNTGSTTLSGDLGVSPGSAITGFPPGTVGGATHPADAAGIQAQTDLTTAYLNAAGQGSTGGGTLSGKTLIPGVYTASSSMGLTGTLTLDAGNDPNAVFIFQAGSTLTTAPNSTVSLLNGAQACHVFWQVGSSATLGTNSTFVGTIMALTSITVTSGATVAGRALARNGAVTLGSNTFTSAACAAAPAVAAPPATAATTATAAATSTATAAPKTTATATTVTTRTTAASIPPATTTTPGLAITGPKHINGLVGIGGALVAVGLIFLWGARTRRPIYNQH